jgi:HK97 family phage portal protein
VGVLEGFRRWITGPSESDLGSQIQWAVDRRLTPTDIESLPAVARARELIVSIVSQLAPLAYDDGIALRDQPRILVRPDEGITRVEWLNQLAGSLFDHGNAYLWIPTSSRDVDGFASQAILLPFADVRVEWSSYSGLRSRRYTWDANDGRQLTPGREIVHIAINRRAGELLGRSAIDICADALYRVLGAEIFAGDYFATGAPPSPTYKYAGELGDEEAIAIKHRLGLNKVDHEPTILPRGWDKVTDDTDPQSSQLLETRRAGTLEAARALGIVPAELILAELGGSSLTYQNVAGMLDTFCRVTVQPLYLRPIEAALGDLVAPELAVSFDTAELYRLLPSEEIATQVAALGAGIFDLPEVRRAHGLPPGSHPVTPSSLEPTGITV